MNLAARFDMFLLLKCIAPIEMRDIIQFFVFLLKDVFQF